MNLVIDVGNTNVKLAVFQKETLMEKRIVMPKDILNEFESLLKEFKEISRGIISSVGRLDKSIVDKMQHQLELIILNSESKLPFINKYATPKTLGVDRIALVSAAVKEFRNKNVLVIDAGTCITYDFKTKKNNYLGGAISPGIKLRYKTLHNLTANLPLLQPKQPENVIGNSTENAIHSGVVNGVIEEISGIVKKYQKNYKDLTVILTGGDSEFLSKQLKSSIFAFPNFLLEGLNHILEINTIE